MRDNNSKNNNNDKEKVPDYINTDIDELVEGAFLSFKDGEHRRLEFLPEEEGKYKGKIGNPVEKPGYGGKGIVQKTQYRVVDTNSVLQAIRIFELADKHTRKIQQELRKSRTLDITRHGTHMNTTYDVTAVIGE